MRVERRPALLAEVHRGRCGTLSGFRGWRFSPLLASTQACRPARCCRSTQPIHGVGGRRVGASLLATIVASLRRAFAPCSNTFSRGARSCSALAVLRKELRARDEGQPERHRGCARRSGRRRRPDGPFGRASEEIPSPS